MEDTLYQAGFIDPRLQEVDATTTRLYSPALKELGYGIPLYVMLYNQIRYYEDYGKLKVGYSVASKEALAKQFGVTVKQIESAYNTLTNIKHLGSWVVCDEKIFRNVKKVWVSNVRQARGTMEDVVKMIENSYSVRAELLQYKSKTLTAEELPTEVPPLSESNIKERETQGSISEMEDSAGSQLEPRIVFLRVNPSGREWKSQKVWSTDSEIERLEELEGDSTVSFKYWKSPKFVGDESKAKIKTTKVKLIQPDVIEEENTVEYNGKKYKTVKGGEVY